MRKIERQIRKFNLQRFSGEGTVVGSDIVYLLRVKKDATIDAGTILAYTTSNNRSLSSGVGTTQTKDGPVATPGTVEETLSVTSYFKKADPMIANLEKALKDGEIMEIWEADLSQPTTGNKYKGTYWEGRISSWGLSSPADGLVEVSTEYVLEGGGKTGDVTVTDEQRAQAYEFRDTLATGA